MRSEAKVPKGRPPELCDMSPAPAALNETLVATAMTDAASRSVLMACVAHARSAKEISARTGIPLTTVYRQAHKLVSLGVLIVERSALTPDGRKYDLYRSRIEQIHLELDETGDHVTWTSDPEVENRIEWSRSSWDVRSRTPSPDGASS